MHSVQRSSSYILCAAGTLAVLLSCKYKHEATASIWLALA